MRGDFDLSFSAPVDLDEENDLALEGVLGREHDLDRAI